MRVSLGCSVMSGAIRAIRSGRMGAGGAQDTHLHDDGRESGRGLPQEERGREERRGSGAHRGGDRSTCFVGVGVGVVSLLRSCGCKLEMRGRLVVCSVGGRDAKTRKRRKKKQKFQDLVNECQNQKGMRSERQECRSVPRITKGSKKCVRGLGWERDQGRGSEVESGDRAAKKQGHSLSGTPPSPNKAAPGNTGVGARDRVLAVGLAPCGPLLASEGLGGVSDWLAPRTGVPFG